MVVRLLDCVAYMDLTISVTVFAVAIILWALHYIFTFLHFFLLHFVSVDIQRVEAYTLACGG